MRKLVFILLTVFCMTVEPWPGVAEEKKEPEKKPVLLSKEDQEILKIIETLKMLDLVENLSLLEDLDILIEEETNEKND